MTPSPPNDWLEAVRERVEAAAGARVSGVDVRYVTDPGGGAAVGAMLSHAIGDLPRALTALQAADALAEAVDRVAMDHSTIPELDAAYEALAHALATYKAARHGER